MSRDADGPQTGHPAAADAMPSNRGRNTSARWLCVTSAPVTLNPADGLVALVLCSLAGAYAWWASGFFDNEAPWSSQSLFDIYFNADIPKLPLYASGVPGSASLFILHPLLFPIVWFAGALGRRLGASLVLAFRASLSTASALGTLLLYLCARGIGTQPPLATLSVLATMATAAFTHWSGTPDHFAL